MMKSNLKIVLTALVSVLLVGAGVGIVGLRAQPSTLGAPTAIRSAQEPPSQTNPDNSQKSGISTDTLNWIEARLSKEMEWIKYVFVLVAAIGGVLVGILGFFGFQKFSSINDRVNKAVNKAVNKKIKEKSNEFLQIFKQEMKGLEDQATIASYNIQFLTPQNNVFETERIIIRPIHLQRFVDILSAKNADQQFLTQIHILLSDVSHDNDSQLVNGVLLQMVSCAETFSWIGNDPTRLSKIIDLLRDRNVKVDPGRVRAFLKDESTAPDVSKSAALYAERVRDTDAVQYLAKILSDKSRLPDADDETIFALVSLDPKNKWVIEWITALKQQPRDHNLAQVARVAGYLMQSLERRSRFSLLRDIETHELEPALNFAETAASLIIDNGGLFFNVGGREKIRIGEFFFEIKGNLFLGHGKVVVSRLCRDLIVKEGIVGITNFAKKTEVGERYNLEANLRGASISVDVDGAPCIIAGRVAKFGLRPPREREFLVASWQTDEGETKTGVVKRIDAPQDAWFSFEIRNSGYELP